MKEIKVGDRVWTLIEMMPEGCKHLGYRLGTVVYVNGPAHMQSVGVDLDGFRRGTGIGMNPFAFKGYELRVVTGMDGK